MFDLDGNFMTCMHHAAKLNNINLIKLFLKHKADINAKDMFERTPLYYAARGGYHDIFRLLLLNRALPWSY